MNTRLVRFTTSDGLLLHGAYYDAHGATTVVHVHGKGGNFYENAFIATLAAAYARVHTNTLTFNNRGAMGISESYRNGQVCYTGGALEVIEEADVDIDAGIRFASERGATRVALQGHSHGCEKVVRYVREGGSVTSVILLSPADSYELQTRYIFPEGIDEQIERLGRLVPQHRFELLDEREYGVATDAVRYPIPIARDALLAWLRSPDIWTFHRQNRALEAMCECPAFLYIGDRDAVQTGLPGGVESCVRGMFRDVHLADARDGDHHLSGVAEVLGEEIGAWLARLGESVT